MNVAISTVTVRKSPRGHVRTVAFQCPFQAMEEYGNLVDELEGNGVYHAEKNESEDTATAYFKCGAFVVLTKH